MQRWPCHHFERTEAKTGCVLGRPFGPAQCIHQCPAYQPKHVVNRQDITDWNEALGFERKDDDVV